MKLTTRDRWLLALLPALCLLLVYLFLLWLPASRQQQELELALKAAQDNRSRGVLPSVDLAELERLRGLQLDAPPVTVAPSSRVPALRMRGLASSLEEHGLSLVAEMPGERGERVLQLEGSYLGVLGWWEQLHQDASAPLPARVELHEDRSAQGALRWSVVLP
jgi:hypothetical protein